MNSIIGSAASPYNDLAIPTIMGPAMLIARGVGFGLFVLFFLAEAFRLQVAAVSHAVDGDTPKPRFGAFVWRALLIFVSSAFLYQWMFLKMVSLCDHIAMTIGNEADWVALIERMTQSGSVSIPFYNITIPSLIGAAAMTALQYVEDVFVLMRFVILSLLYVVGPIAWAFGVSSLGFGAIRGWFKNTWQVCFWLVMFAVIKAAVVPLGLAALDTQRGVSYFDNAVSNTVNNAVSVGMVSTVYAIVVLLAMTMIPTLTAALFSEANIGAVASSVMAIASYSTLRSAASRGQSAHSGVLGKVAVNDAASAYKTFGGLKGIKEPWKGTKAVMRGMVTPQEATPDAASRGTAIPQDPAPAAGSAAAERTR